MQLEEQIQLQRHNSNRGTAAAGVHNSGRGLEAVGLALPIHRSSSSSRDSVAWDLAISNSAVAADPPQPP